MTLTHLPRGAGRAALATVAALALATACGSSSGSTGTAAGSTGGSGTGTVKLGHLATLTGPSASIGVSQANSIELAVDQINAAGGFTAGGKKYTIDLDTQDDKSDPTSGVTAVQKIRSDGNKLMIGTLASSVLGAYLPIVKSDQDFIDVVVSAATVGVTDNVSVYRPRVTLDQYTAATVAYLTTKAVTSVGILTDSVHAGFVADTPNLVASLKKAGIGVSSQGSYKLGDTDFSAQLTSALKAKPQALNLRGYPADTARIVAQARQLGFTGLIITNSGLTKTEVTNAQAAPAMTNVVDIFGATTQDLLTSPQFGTAAKAFNDAYHAKYSGAPGVTSASAYTGVNILVAAMEKAGTTTDIPKIRTALDALKTADVQNVVDSIQPNSSGLIFTNHQASYEIVARGYNAADGDFHADSFLTGS